MHVIEREILNITHYKVQRKFSDRQDYLKSVFTAVQRLRNDEFDELTDEAATWANACVEAYNTDKDGDLPDFDEIGDPDEDEDGDEESTLDDESEVEDDEVVDSNEATASTDGGNGEDSDEDEEESNVQTPGLEDEDELEKVIPPKKLKKVVKETKPKSLKQQIEDNDDVSLDKWGSMIGSKNSAALAMFAKGATATEVKNALGGTYYNILKKMVSHGHKLEKYGAVIKLIHLTEKSSRLSAPKRSKK